MLPNIIIFGAMKAGTTSLYNYIASHPDVVPSSIKETDFFKTRDTFEKGINWYESLFDQKDGKCGLEASPNYSKRHYFPGVPARMHSVLPHAKLIYVIREPIERIVSNYIHNCSQGRESRPFRDIIKPNSGYILTSKYFYQLEAFLEYYDADNILIVESEKLRTNTTETLEHVSNFIGISSNFDLNITKKQFHNSAEKATPCFLERKMLETTQNRYLRKIIKKTGTHFRRPISTPVLRQEDKEFLIEELTPDVEKLRDFANLDLQSWLT